MNTLTAVTSVVASHGEHDGHFFFPFALFWIVAIGFAIWFFTRGRRHHRPTGAERAQDILAERFARGELTGEEYRERLEQIR